MTEIHVMVLVLPASYAYLDKHIKTVERHCVHGSVHCILFKFVASVSNGRTETAISKKA